MTRLTPSACVLVFGLRVPGAHAAERAVAVTFDDLPAVSAVSDDVASLADLTRRLLDAVRRHHIPAVGFVNEGKLFVEGAPASDVAGRTELLRMWVDAGVELGNHTYSHRSLNQTPLEEFEADVVRGEPITRSLMEAKGRKLRYFRHPFLHVGDALPKRRTFETFLVAHGYTIAPVTPPAGRLRGCAGELLAQPLGGDGGPPAGSDSGASGVDHEAACGERAVRGMEPPTS
jgi:peptidoglycan/xylan/chitin deacetylase (PgdA/CDA1 family)